MNKEPKIEGLLEMAKFYIIEKQNVEAYKNNCPRYKEEYCAGDSVSPNSGCTICKRDNVYDYSNAFPGIKSGELDDFINERKVAFNNAHKSCIYKYADGFCDKKGIFNFCCKCDSIFKRSR